MRHHHEQALALAERSVALHEIARVRPRPRGGARDPRADLRSARRSRARRADPHEDARRPQLRPVPRDDRRRVRHPRADSPDAGLVRTRGGVPPARERGLRRVRHDHEVVRVVVEGTGREGRHPPGCLRPGHPDGARSGPDAGRPAGRSHPGRPRGLRGAGGRRPDRGGRRAAGDLRGAPGSPRRARYVGRVPAHPRDGPRAHRPQVGGASRLRSERERLRPARRTLPGRR